MRAGPTHRISAVLAVTAYDVVLGVHVLGVVVAFGVIFAYPVMFALAARHDPRSLPLIHRIETFVDRTLVNGALVVVVGAGIFLASDGHHWKEFFVQWGLGAAIVIGGLVGSVMIPASKKAQRLAERDLAAGGGSEGVGTDAGPGPVQMSEEYRAVTRRLALVGGSLSVLVVATILLMAIKP
jgi:hypothetical protein